MGVNTHQTLKVFKTFRVFLVAAHLRLDIPEKMIV